jgi:hypothetical protein
MQELAWVIDFRFPYPASCTPAQLLTILKRLAVDWPGMPKFPWRVTRNIHKFLGRPPVNFYYLMIHRCLMGCAAHLVLNATFASREAVLTMILREKVEIIGMLRLLLIDAIRAEVSGRRRGVPIERENFVVIESLPLNHMLAPLYLQRVLGQKNWDAYLDVFGIPSLFLIGPPQTSTAMELEYQKIAEAISSEGKGYLPNGTDIKYVTGGGGKPPYRDRLDYCGRRNETGLKPPA